jgi:hypothetical protein
MPKTNPLYAAIQATPTRKVVSSSSQLGGYLLSVPGHDTNAYLPSSPLHVRRSSAQLFTAIPDSAAKGLSSFSSYGIQETPMKRRQETTVDHSHPGLSGSASDKENDGIETKEGMIASSSQESGRKEDDIYKSLGWDDPDDIDDLA